jgi:hypothetical protein
MTIKHFILSIYLLLTLSFWSCDAPRNNPFDPQNPDYESALDLTGNVYTYRVPHVAISNVKVTWDNRRIDYSKTDGSFRFNAVVQEPGWLYFENNSYLVDSMYIDFTSLNVTKYLNTRPVLDSLLFYSSIDNKNDGRQLTSIEARLHISDPDNDIDSVLIISKTLNFYRSLTYNISDKYFEGSYTFSKPDAVLGHEYEIYIRDTQKNKIYLSKQIIKRVIKEDLVKLNEPDNGDTTIITPTLKWQRNTNPGFPFKYTVEIYTDGFNPTLVWHKDNITPDLSVTNTIAVDIPLTEDRYYFWNVWVVDEFQNRSISLEKGFYAKSP